MTAKTTPVEALNTLHTVVAKVLVTELTKIDMVMINGEEVDISSPSPAMVAQAIKFLKDNNISSTVEDDVNLNELEDILKKKLKHSSLASVSPIKAAQED